MLSFFLSFSLEPHGRANDEYNNNNNRAVDYTCAGSAATKTLASGQQYLGCTTTFGHAVAMAGATAIRSGSTYAASTVTEAAGQGIGVNGIAVRFKSGDFAATTGKQTDATVSHFLKTGK